MLKEVRMMNKITKNLAVIKLLLHEFVITVTIFLNSNAKRFFRFFLDNFRCIQDNDAHNVTEITW